MTGQTRDIGRFTGAELIGRGGFGSVYKAHDAEHGRDVAIKVLQGSLGETERRRFDRERQTMGRLGAHPNIIPVHESGYTDTGEGYIVMELAAGGSLGDRLDRNERLDWSEAVPIAAAIASAAQAAHDKGVLHRDIKPDNILIDAYNNPRLTDFGIAAVASNATATTSTTATLAHAAPEILHGQASTAAVDIYAVGSTLYNLITGTPPFLRPDEEGVTAMIMRTLTEPPPDIRVWGVPDPVARVIERALAKSAADRQPTAAVLASELTAAINGTAPPVTPVAPNPAGGATVSAAPPVHDPRRQAGAPPLPSQPVPAAAVGANPIGTTPFPNQAVGGQAPGAPGYAGPPPAASPRRGGLLLGLGALAVLVLAGIGLAIALGGGDDNDATATAGESSTTSSESSSTTADESGTTASSSSSTTSTTASTTTEAPTTTEPSSSTTATSVTSPPVDPDCPRLVLGAATPRFDVTICADSGGNLTYRGQNRDNDQDIELPACYAGGGAFFAQNEGFTYEVNTVTTALTVADPDGSVVVDEPLLAPIEVGDTTGVATCG